MGSRSNLRLISTERITRKWVLPATKRQGMIMDKGVRISIWSITIQPLTRGAGQGPGLRSLVHSASLSPASPLQKRAEEWGSHGEWNGHAAVRAEQGRQLGRVEEGWKGAEAKWQIQNETGRPLCWAGNPRPRLDRCWELHLHVWRPEDYSYFESEW